MEKFSLIPNAVFGDRRLTFEQMRVLCGLYSFCNSERTCWPSRQAIAERTGVHAEKDDPLAAAAETAQILLVRRPGVRERVVDMRNGWSEIEFLYGIG